MCRTYAGPEGCFADEYHWRDGIGPQRVVRLNPNWGGVIEPNTFGTYEFMDFIDQIGSEAYVSLNLGSGSPHEAADRFAIRERRRNDSLQPGFP